MCWLFGKQIHDTLGVPVGLISSSWGGTSIQVRFLHAPTHVHDQRSFLPALAHVHADHWLLPALSCRCGCRRRQTRPASRGIVRHRHLLSPRVSQEQLALGVSLVESVRIRVHSGNTQLHATPNCMHSQQGATSLHVSTVAGSGDRYNAMIAPLTVGPMALGGIIWYQGESNNGQVVCCPARTLPHSSH